MSQYEDALVFQDYLQSKGWKVRVVSRPDQPQVMQLFGGLWFRIVDPRKGPSVVVSRGRFGEIGGAELIWNSATEGYPSMQFPDRDPVTVADAFLCLVEEGRVTYMESNEVVQPMSYRPATLKTRLMR